MKIVHIISNVYSYCTNYLTTLPQWLVGTRYVTPLYNFYCLTYSCHNVNIILTTIYKLVVIIVIMLVKFTYIGESDFEKFCTKILVFHEQLYFKFPECIKLSQHICIVYTIELHSLVNQ